MRLAPAIALIATLLAVAMPPAASAVKVSGGLSGSVYNRDDDISSQDYTISRMRLKLDAEELGNEKTSFHFTGATRSTGANDFNSQIPDSRIDTATLGIQGAFSFLDATVGRQYIQQIPTARVDGVNIRVHMGKNFGIGAFGGQEPDPYDDTVNSDYITYGGYAFMNTLNTGANLGYVVTQFKGSEDTSYVYGSGYLAASKALRTFATARSDHNVTKGGFELTNLLVGASYRPNRRARFSVSYNQYRAITLFGSMDYSLNHELQKTARIAGDIRIARTIRIYGRADARNRESDNKSASLYLLGIKQSDVFRWFFYDVSLRSINYFTSKSIQARSALGAQAGDDLTAEISAMYIKNAQDDASNDLVQWVYSAELDWYPDRSFYVSGKVEMSNESYVDVDSVYVAKASDKYSSMTYFLYVSYRF